MPQLAIVQYILFFPEDFILPICLPTRPVSALDENVGRIVSLTGYGKRKRNDLETIHELTRVSLGIFSQRYW